MNQCTTLNEPPVKNIPTFQRRFYKHKSPFERNRVTDYTFHYFQDSLNSLKKNLQNKWEFITMQAEEQVKNRIGFFLLDFTILVDQFRQKLKYNLRRSNILRGSFVVQVRLSKDRKKGEKIVTDSQERAFWRVHRPPPGHVSVMEQIPIKIGGSFSTKKKRSSEDLRREVSNKPLKISITFKVRDIPRVKIPDKSLIVFLLFQLLFIIFFM